MYNLNSLFRSELLSILRRYKSRFPEIRLTATIFTLRQQIVHFNLVELDRQTPKTEEFLREVISYLPLQSRQIMTEVLDNTLLTFTPTFSHLEGWVFMECLFYNRSLEMIDLSYRFPISTFIEKTENLTSLTSLRITCLIDKDIPILHTYLLTHPSITHLKIKYLSNNNISQLLSLLKTNKHLLHLGITGLQETQDNTFLGKSISEFIETNNTLKFLKIRNCGIGDVGGQLIGKSLSFNSTLQHLDLRGNKLGSLTSKQFSTIISHHEYLISLRGVVGQNISKYIKRNKHNYENKNITLYEKLLHLLEDT